MLPIRPKYRWRRASAVCVTSVALLASRHAARADEGAGVAVVRLLDGTTLRGDERTYVQGDLVTPGFEVQLKLAGVRSIGRNADGATLHVELPDGAPPLDAAPGRYAGLRVFDAAGDHTVPYEKLASFAWERPPKPQVREVPFEWLLELASGRTVACRLQGSPVDGMSGAVGRITIELPLRRIDAVRFGPDGATVTAGDRTVLSGWRPAVKYRWYAETAFGTLAVSPANFVSVRRAPNAAKAEPIPDFHPAWRIVDRAGGTHGVAGISGASPVPDAGVRFVRLDFARVASATGAGEAVQLTTQAGESWRFTGEFHGDGPLGRLTIHSHDVASIERAEDAPAPPAPPTTPASTLTTASGRVLRLRGSPVLAPGDPIAPSQAPWGHGIGAVAYERSERWIDGGSILRWGLVRHGRVLTSTHPQLAGVDIGPLGGSIEASSEIGDLRIELGAVVSYEPAAPPDATATPPPEIRLRVTSFDGTVRVLEGRALETACYPETAWSGWYASGNWPFQWWRRQDLRLSLDGATEPRELPLDAIEDLDTSRYNDGRRVRCRLRQGAPVEGRLFLGPVAASAPGVTQWSDGRAGLLLRLASAVYVFVPFGATRDVQWTRLPAAK